MSKAEENASKLIIPKQLKEIEIPFGAKDSELCGWEYTIPEGMEATVVDNKIVVKKKESEDERIRKAMISGMTALKEQGKEFFATIPLNDCIDWLEKQGEEKSLYDIAKEVIKDKDAATSFLKSCGIMNENGELADEYKIKQGEQKSVDNVEPKFHEGDFIVNKEGNVYKVVGVCDIVENEYRLRRLSDNGFIRASISVVNRRCHLWDITEDARDGEVLVSQYDKPFIYNGNHNSFYIGSYCGISTESRFNVATEKCRWTENVNVHPATQEQCDFLFQKMKEAGYEWDAEKKELKKIEHTCKINNSYTCVTFPFKAKVKSSGKIVTIHDGQLSQDGKEWIKYQSDAEDRYKVYESNNLELVCEIEPTPTWSEEDEINYNYALVACIYYGETKGYADTEIHQKTKNWLKSIKYIHFWKPNDAQIEALEHFVRSIGESGYTSPYENNTKLLYSLLEQLKKLREK